MKCVVFYPEKIQETFEQDNFMAYFTGTIDTMLNKTITRWKKSSALGNGEGFQL